MSIRYYCSPSYVHYLQLLGALAKCGGYISSKSAFLSNIQSEAKLNPGRLNYVYSRYYGGNISNLEQSIREMRTTMVEVWKEFLRASDNCGIERTHGQESEDYPLYKDFYDRLCLPEKKCDLRAKVLEWTNTDLRRIEAGVETDQPSEEMLTSKNWRELRPLSVLYLMERYDELCHKRQGEKQ